MAALPHQPERGLVLRADLDLTDKLCVWAEDLRRAGVSLLPPCVNASAADFTVEGDIKTAPGAGNTTRVEIQWIVTDAKGQESGRVVQINEVPPHTLDQFWGEVAVVVANEAAGGVHEVITNATGRGKKPDMAKAKADPDDR